MSLSSVWIASSCRLNKPPSRRTRYRTCTSSSFRRRGDAGTREFLAELVAFVRVASADTDSIRYAAGRPMDDFADAMQVADDRACGARCIVTRNLWDYDRSPIPALSPQDLLSELA